MKTFLFAATLLPLTAFATPQLSCGFSGIEYPYSVEMTDSNTAVVNYKNKTAQFGHLQCQEVKDELFMVSQCASKDVTDAGFRVNLKYSSTTGYFVDFYEVSLRGLNLIVTLPCWQ